jgi:beta-galactosidase
MKRWIWTVVAGFGLVALGCAGGGAGGGQGSAGAGATGRGGSSGAAGGSQSGGGSTGSAGTSGAGGGSAIAGTTGSGGAAGSGGGAGGASGAAGIGGQAGQGTAGTGGPAGAGGIGGGGRGGGAAGTGGLQTATDASRFSMDPGWKFVRQDVTGAQAVAFDDSAWTTVSTPHTYNDVDSYRVYANHSSGDTGTYDGPAWYRKHFKIPASYSGGKVILEFERIRQAARFYINGTSVGSCEDGITACGVDVTGKVNFGATENVLAVRVDNNRNYVESTTNTGFEWTGKAFNPDYGGLVGHVWLHVPGKLYQTYPLYNNLQTTGVYVYPSAFANVTAAQGDVTVNVESQVRNETDAARNVTLSVEIFDAATGFRVTTFQGSATAISAGQTVTLKASGPLPAAKLWSDLTPNLYDVVTSLMADGGAVSRRTTRTGFRQTQFRGGVGTGGVYVNGRFVYLLGYAQRASNDWAALGQAVPDWMHDYTTNLVKGSNSNYIRWMHITPQRVDVASDDKFGVINIAPAGDKEADVTGVQWTQRTNVMRASIIYLRNNPSILFWEAGNNGISAAHMKEMQDLRKQWDPNGGRAMGCRDLDDAGAAPYAEYFGTMVGYDPSWTPSNDTDYHRGYSNDYRNRAPIIEAEDERDEAARRYWDDYSPPHVGGFKPGPDDTYHWTSESIITGDSTTKAAIWRLDIWKNVYSIQNKDSAHSRYAGYASIYFSDSDADGRQMSSEVARASGKVDAVRLPKQLYFAHRVVGNPQPDIHIIGHWNYPAGTRKTMYVVANTPQVELFVNATSIGKSSTPTDHYLFSFPNVTWSSGMVRAVGYDASGKQVASHQLQTVGAAASLKLTATVGPGDLQADGADVVMIDFEVVDAAGQRVPTDEARVDFSMTGPGVWRGGYNSGVLASTNNMYLMTEAGINRVFVRSTLTPGTITVTATRAGLTAASVSVTSKAVPVVDGLL